MTYLERALEIHKEEGDKNIGSDWITENLCPYDYELDEFKECREDNIDKERCKACWNRKMPNTELEKVKEAFSEIGKAISKASEDVYKEDMNTAYNKGLNDAWELARKINNMEFKEFIKVFERTGYDGREVKMNLINELTPQEALAKMKAYEEAQKIKVGDIIETKDFTDKWKAVVLDILNKDKAWILNERGCVFGVELEILRKTGKHIDIQSILEQIGE